MSNASLSAEQFSKWTAVEKTRQECLFAATVVEEALSLLILEESMKRERLEQRLRHERTLIKLSLGAFTPRRLLHAELERCASSRVPSTQLDFDEPLPFDNVDQLTEEDVERIWLKEKLQLQRNIEALSARVQKLRK